MGPVIRDNRRIDPVTGQARRGKHAAFGHGDPWCRTPAGGPGATRPGRAGEDGAAPAAEVTQPEGEAAPAPAPAAGGGGSVGSGRVGPGQPAARSAG